MSSTTDFGFKQVDPESKASLVSQVFHSVAGQYDLMNDLMSFGAHRLWKRFTLDASLVRPGQRVLDVAAGTGDLTAAFSNLVGSNGLVISTDINESMLNRGRDKLLDEGVAGNVSYVIADAENLPLKANSFDCISIAFGLRNVTNKSKALGSMFEALKPGGRLLVLEFSKPVLPLLNSLYDFY